MIATRVKINCSDSVIWNKEQTIIELSQAANKGPVVIDLRTEGPCCEYLGLNQLIDLLVNQYGFDLEQFSLMNTGNQLCSSRLKESKTILLGNFVQQFDNFSHFVNDSTLQKRFGLFIGRSNWIRLGIASYLWSEHRDLSRITFHYNNELDFHKSNFGLEQFVQRYYHEKTRVVEFLNCLPLCFDTITQYPITALDLSSTDLMCSLAPAYRDIFCEIVCESYFSGKTFHLTEKTLRPMLYKRPFVIQGPKHFLKNLKLLGFKTFDQWWDEGYDQDHHDSRYEAITNNIKWIAGQSPMTIAKWYKEMQSTLEHNFITALALTNQKILTTNFYYD